MFCEDALWACRNFQESAKYNNWETKGTPQPMAISPVKADNAIGV